MVEVISFKNKKPIIFWEGSNNVFKDSQLPVNYYMGNLEKLFGIHWTIYNFYKEDFKNEIF